MQYPPPLDYASGRDNRMQTASPLSHPGYGRTEQILADHDVQRSGANHWTLLKLKLPDREMNYRDFEDRANELESFPLSLWPRIASFGMTPIIHASIRKEFPHLLGFQNMARGRNSK